MSQRRSIAEIHICSENGIRKSETTNRNVPAGSGGCVSARKVKARSMLSSGASNEPPSTCSGSS
jgi:hypothetical protein